MARKDEQEIRDCAQNTLRVYDAMWYNKTEVIP